MARKRSEEVVIAEIIAEPAMRAFDHLGAEANKVANSALDKLVVEHIRKAKAKAPGGLAPQIKGERRETARGINTYLILSDEVKAYGGKPVAYWVNWGTYGKFPRKRKEEVRKERTKQWISKGYGIRPRRFLTRISRRKQLTAVHKAVLLAAHKAGFKVEP